MSFAAGAETLVDFSRDIWTVSRLNSEVRAVLEGSFPLLWVQGELSNLSRPASGHLYFTLKDAAAQARCAMFRFQRRLLQFEPANGAQVLVRARVGLYETRGDYQLLVEHMEPAGEGALRIELERRKQRLAAAGLFAEARKRPLPAFPRQLGLITSASGAALHDLLTVLRRRLPLLPVLIYPARVQGDGAAESLLEALALANRRGDCDLLILARGGGSLEDLMAFNDEALVRAIAASELPVLTGIGHEVDVSLADLAADRRGATPSAAAELATPTTAADLRRRIDTLATRLQAARRQTQQACARRLDSAVRHLRLLHPLGRLRRRGQDLDALERRLRAAIARGHADHRARIAALTTRLRARGPQPLFRLWQERLNRCRAQLVQAIEARIAARSRRLGLAAAGLEARGPLATLARGYAIATTVEDGKLLRDVTTVAEGTRIEVRVARGAVIAAIERIHPPPT